jgi:hypothetical protein
VASFSRSSSSSKSSHLQSFISSSNQPIIDSAHGLHGLIKTIDALNLGVLGFTEFSSFGTTNFIGTSPNLLLLLKDLLLLGNQQIKRKKK